MSAARPIAVVTFDEPEFEPSYAGTPNQGKGAFAWLFFTGRCRFSHLSPAVLRSAGPLRGAAYLVAGLFYATRSLFVPCRTVFEVLAEEGVRATFFGVFELLGESGRRETYLPVYRRILAEGHELGLHGYRHGPLSEDDLDRSLRIARDDLGVGLATYSSPFGADRPETAALLERRGFVGMRVWDRGLLGHEGRMRRVPYEYRMDKILSAGEPVLVVNLHSGDCYPRGFGRLRKMVGHLKRLGYRFMTFGELCAGADLDEAAA